MFGFAITKNPFKASLLGVAVIAVVVVFQNCGKAGFDTVESASLDGVNQALAKAPVPLEASLNQLSYMSCPAVASNQTDPDVLANPYYTLRFGGFSNDTLLAVTDGSSGGVGISKAGLDYVKNNFPVF